MSSIQNKGERDGYPQSNPSKSEHLHQSSNAVLAGWSASRARPIVSLFTGIRRGPDQLLIESSLDHERQRGFVVVRLHLEEESHTEEPIQPEPDYGQEERAAEF